MKILVTYVSAGSGHKRIAESITAYLKSNFSQHDIQIFDALDYTNLFLKKSYSGLYNFLVKYAKWAWWACFWFTDAKWLYLLSKPLMFISHRLTTAGFAKFLIKQNADIIISTHFLPSEIASFLKRSKRINSLLATVITDYGVHSYWIHSHTDLYAVASTATGDILISKGVEKQHIRITGLPVEDKFVIAHDRKNICGRLGIKEGEFTALIMTGSFGMGPIKEVARCLEGKAQLLVVCAKNQRLFKQLKDLNLKDVKVFGFISNVYELMAVSDIIITKPGGSTVSEILAMGLVPVFISAIPGQEYENARVLAEHGIGNTPANIKELESLVLDYKAHPEKLAAVKANMKKFFVPHADSELSNALCKGSVRPLN